MRLPADGPVPGSDESLTMAALRMDRKLRQTLRRVLPASSLDDVLQDLHVRLLSRTQREADNSGPIRDVEAYVFAAALNLASASIRRELKHEGALIAERTAALKSVTESPSELSPERIAAAQDQLLHVLSALPREHGEALWLVKGEGCSYQEAGATLRITPETVQKRLREAMLWFWRHESPSTDRRASRNSALLYDLHHTARVPREEIVQCLSPKIIVANAALAEQLKARPEGVRALTPRQFERLIAEIVEDWGWNVQLTPATRDGGFDILATIDTELGCLMWLIETKLYGAHHKVGFDLVQRLYGAFASVGATHGMLVTTSSFTAPARELQAKHSYHLTLREYRDVLNWIERYGTHQRTPGSAFGITPSQGMRPTC